MRRCGQEGGRMRPGDLIAAAGILLAGMLSAPGPAQGQEPLRERMHRLRVLIRPSKFLADFLIVPEKNKTMQHQYYLRIIIAVVISIIFPVGLAQAERTW